MEVKTMRKSEHKLRNLYSVHDREDKAIALILAKDEQEARQIWRDRNNHDTTFSSSSIARQVKFKEIQKHFQIYKLTSLLSEKRMQPGKSLLCTKLARYYIY